MSTDSNSDKIDELEKENGSFKNLIKWLVGVPALVIILALSAYFWQFHGDLSSGHEVWGTFGDFIGGLLNPMLAFASFIALLWTIKQQNQAMVLSAKELALTREELEATREELARSADAAELSQQVASKQSQMIELQQFESSFYSLLEQHNNMYAAVGDPQIDSGDNIEWVKNDILAHYGLSQYFRILYQLIKHIVTNHPSNETNLFTVKYLQLKPTKEEKKYASIVRSCIGSNMLVLLAGNCFCENGEKDEFYKYYLMLERFQFLEHIGIDKGSLQQQSCGFGGAHWDILNHYQFAFGHAKTRLVKSLDSIYRESIRDGNMKRLEEIESLGNINAQNENLEKLMKNSFFQKWLQTTEKC